MAIIYTYANFSPLNGSEKVLISDSDTNQATRTATAQQIANLAGGETGVNRVYFADAVGLTPKYKETIGNETVGRGVVEFSGTVKAGAGGTGKDSADLTAATIGQVLVLNAAKDGWDFSSTIGVTYTIEAEQLGAVPPYQGAINLIDSTPSTVGTVKIVGGTDISITANNVAGTITITNDAPAVTYTGGNGIDITGSVISVELGLSNPGLAFDSGRLEVDLNSTNVGGSVGSPGDCLIADGVGGMDWASRPQEYAWAWTPCLCSDPANPASELQVMGYIEYDPTSAGGGTIVGQKGSIRKIGSLIYYDFYLKFRVTGTMPVSYPAPGNLCLFADRNATPGGPGSGDPWKLPVVYEAQVGDAGTLPESQLNNASVMINEASTSGPEGVATTMWQYIPQGGKVSRSIDGIVDFYTLIYNGTPAVGNGLQTIFEGVEWMNQLNEDEWVTLSGSIIAQTTIYQPSP